MKAIVDLGDDVFAFDSDDVKDTAKEAMCWVLRRDLVDGSGLLLGYGIHNF